MIQLTLNNLTNNLYNLNLVCSQHKIYTVAYLPPTL